MRLGVVDGNFDGALGVAGGRLGDEPVPVGVCALVYPSVRIDFANCSIDRDDGDPSDNANP